GVRRRPPGQVDGERVEHRGHEPAVVRRGHRVDPHTVRIRRHAAGGYADPTPGPEDVAGRPGARWRLARVAPAPPAAPHASGAPSRHGRLTTSKSPTHGARMHDSPWRNVRLTAGKRTTHPGE